MKAQDRIDKLEELIKHVTHGHVNIVTAHEVIEQLQAFHAFMSMTTFAEQDDVPRSVEAIVKEAMSKAAARLGTTMDDVGVESGDASMADVISEALPDIFKGLSAEES